MHLLYLARARLASRATTDEGALVSLATMLLAALGVMRRETRDGARDSRSSTTHGAFTALAPVWALCAMSARASGRSTRGALAASTASAFSAGKRRVRRRVDAVERPACVRERGGVDDGDAGGDGDVRVGRGDRGDGARRRGITSGTTRDDDAVSGRRRRLGDVRASGPNAPRDVSEATALACAFALAGVCFLSASARLGVGPTGGGTTRAVVVGAAFVLPEMFYRACTNSTNMLAGVVRYALRTDAESLKTLTALWVSGVVVAASAAYNARAVSLTMRRKAFHFLVVVMFAPTLTRDSAHGELVRVAFAVAFAVFAAVECARVFDAYYGVGVFGWKLSLLLAQFVDESVVSLIILDHFSLLLGIAVPVWMTAVEDTNTLAPWAGVLAVGVGDSFASLVGSSVGRVRVFGKESPKTLEGAIAFAASTFIAARFVGVDIGIVKLAAACVATAACELVDDGVDNFVLPLYFAALVGL